MTNFLNDFRDIENFDDAIAHAATLCESDDDIKTAASALSITHGGSEINLARAIRAQRKFCAGY